MVRAIPKATAKRIPAASAPTTAAQEATPQAPQGSPANGAPTQPRAVEGAQAKGEGVEMGDVCDLIPAHLAQMPLGTALFCLAGNGVRFVITTSRAEYQAARAARVPTFTGSELVALTMAAENSRAWSHHLHEWLRTKAQAPQWALKPQAAMCGISAHGVTSRGWTLGEVLRAYGVRLTEVRVDGDVAQETQQGGKAA